MAPLPNLSALSLRAAQDTDAGLENFEQDLIEEIVRGGLADESTLEGVCKNLDSGWRNLMQMGQGNRLWRDAAIEVRTGRNDAFFETLYRSIFPNLPANATPAQAVPHNGILFPVAVQAEDPNDPDPVPQFDPALTLPNELQAPVTWKGAFRAACWTLQRLDYVCRRWSRWRGPDWRHFFPVWLHNKAFVRAFGELWWEFKEHGNGNHNIQNFCLQFEATFPHLAQNDVTLMVEMMRVTHGRLLEHLPTMRNNKWVVLAAIRADTSAIEWASDDFKRDRPFIEMIVPEHIDIDEAVKAFRLEQQLYDADMVLKWFSKSVASTMQDPYDSSPSYELERIYNALYILQDDMPDLFQNETFGQIMLKVDLSDFFAREGERSCVHHWHTNRPAIPLSKEMALKMVKLYPNALGGISPDVVDKDVVIAAISTLSDFIEANRYYPAADLLYDVRDWMKTNKVDYDKDMAIAMAQTSPYNLYSTHDEDPELFDERFLDENADKDVVRAAFERRTKQSEYFFLDYANKMSHWLADESLTAFQRLLREGFLEVLMEVDKDTVLWLFNDRDLTYYGSTPFLEYLSADVQADPEVLEAHEEAKRRWEESKRRMEEAQRAWEEGKRRREEERREERRQEEERMEEERRQEEERMEEERRQEVLEMEPWAYERAKRTQEAKRRMEEERRQEGGEEDEE